VRRARAPLPQVRGTSAAERQGAALQTIARVCTLCNDAELAYEGEEGAVKKLGEPTEAALKVVAEKIGSPGSTRPAHGTPDFLHATARFFSERFARRATLEFTRDRKSMSVLLAPSGTARGAVPNVLLVKGAPESVLARCTHVLNNDGRRVRGRARARVCTRGAMRGGGARRMMILKH
jgi:Ca2+ transporting ATPase